MLRVVDVQPRSVDKEMSREAGRKVDDVDKFSSSYALRGAVLLDLHS